MKIPFVDLKAQYKSIKEKIDAAIFDCVENTAFIQGKRVNDFENAFASFLGVKHVIGCANGTDAIFLALKAIGVKQGDEVITAANSFIATSEAITMTGAQVVFADVNARTNNISCETIEPKITKKTKVLLPVHLYGYPADMKGIREMAGRYGLRIVADAAQAHGAEIDGISAAHMADVTTYSFFPGKNLGAYGDAGAVATDNDEIAEYIRKMRNHGRLGKYTHDFEGVNMRMDEIQGAVLGVKLPYLNDWTDARRRHASYYSRNLAGTGDLSCPGDSEDVKAVYHLYVIETDRRDELQKYLDEKGISTGIHYPVPLPFQPAYAYLNVSEEDMPVCARKAKRILSIPMYPELTEDQQDYVVEMVKSFFEKERKSRV